MISGNEKKLISPYIDGELSPGQEVELEKLIEASTSLQKDLSDMKELRASVSSIGKLDLRDEKFVGFAQSISEELKSAPSKPRFSQRFATSPNPRFSRISMGTVAAILLVVLVSFGIGYKKGVVKGNSVQIHEMEVDDSMGVDFYSPEGASYTVLKITPREMGNVNVNYIETAEGLEYKVEPSTNSNSVIIRLSEPIDDDELEEK